MMTTESDNLFSVVTRQHKDVPAGADVCIGFIPRRPRGEYRQCPLWLNDTPSCHIPIQQCSSDDVMMMYCPDDMSPDVVSHYKLSCVRQLDRRASAVIPDELLGGKLDRSCSDDRKLKGLWAKRPISSTPDSCIG